MITISSTWPLATIATLVVIEDACKIMKIEKTDQEEEQIDHFISLPFSSSSPIDFICSFNGWLVFVNHNNEILHLFDPVSN
ncbi:hypothetical protein IEQ34_022470 [Dendrobium chrysotoxum]|uniref:Uncharacterized protein n=1 Tax=Dendrobium chrysotoxum TaxID=161865 RepID=A0AAV7FZ51_DENCH|nr:hypothetical protein IEQ34_022470 [Dendrobium chrysotoxum]